MPKQFAETTSVPIAKSRGEIDALLRKWGCDGIRWTELRKEGRAILEFTWDHEAETYLARFSLKLPDDETLRKRSKNKASGNFMETKYEREKENAGRQEHRVLLVFLLGAFNAIEKEIMSAEAIFLPFFVGADGRTMAETLLPKLPQLLSSGADMLLELPERIK